MTNKAKKIFVNGLTFSRIIGAMILPFLFLKVNTAFLVIVLAITFLTDFFDGFLARKWHIQTIGGKILDPIGDKLIFINWLISLSRFHKNMLVLLIMELTIGIISGYRVMTDEKTTSSFIGRVKTWFVAISILLVMVDRILISKDFSGIAEFSIGLTSFIELATIYSYLKTIEPRRKKIKSKEKIEYKSLKEILTRLFDEKSFEVDCNKPIMELLKK